MLRAITILIILILLFPVLLEARPAPKTPDTPVKLRVRLLDTRFCQIDAEIYNAVLILQATIINDSNMDVWIPEQLEVLGDRIARNEADFRALRFERVFFPEHFVEDPVRVIEVPLDDHPPATAGYRRIKPHGERVVKLKTTVQVRSDSARPLSGAISSGDHVIEFVVGNPRLLALPKDATEGRVYANQLVSTNRVRLSIPRSQSRQSCH